MENGPANLNSELMQNFKIYVLEMPAGDVPEAGVVRCQALIVLRRQGGFLLCVPVGYFNDEVLAAGLMAGADDQIGQSTTVSIPAGTLQDVEEAFGQPVPVPGSSIDVLLIDVSLDVRDHLIPFNPGDPLADGLMTFDSMDPLSFPMTDELVSAAWNWVQDPGSGERAAFYSALEEEEEEDVQTAPLPPRPRAKAGPGTGGGGVPKDQKKRPTVASLSASLEQLSGSIPALLEEVKHLSQRTSAMEQQMTGGGRPSALRQPLGSLATQHSVQEMEAEMDPLDSNASLTHAVMIQSKALSTLVASLAGSDGVVDLSSGSSGFSSRGAQGRIKLQQELAQHRGTYFNSIFTAMARRMQPARVAEAAPAELAARGVTATQYVERYGGYGRCRDIGNIMWQVALALDHLQNDNIGAAKDSIALLAVCLEQTSLDSGRMDVGLLLALTEDPPSGVFTNRNLQSYSRGRAFAPLADQKWIANALSYIKELDTISTRRSGCHRQTQRQPVKGRKHSRAEFQESSKEGSPPLEEEATRGGGGGGSLGSDLHAAFTTFPKVLSALPRWILATRTPFASFLAQTFHLQCCGQTPATVVYPLPLADFGLFCRGSPKLSRRRWLTLLKKRLRHVLIVALNYLHGGICHQDLHLLGRRPNKAQIGVHHRLWALLSTCDSPEQLSVVPGRSGPEFIARLLELEHFAKSCDVFEGTGYGGGPYNFEAAAEGSSSHLRKVGETKAEDRHLPAEPYSNLNSDRLRLVGSGQWRLGDFLEDELWMPFQEPAILHHHLPLSQAVGPNLAKEDREENFKLALLWSSHGLLSLFREAPHKQAFTRIFNARKNQEVDRQIGDRRYANFVERHIAGPSKHLPAGYLLTGIYVKKGHIILGSITDRKDFYHQASVTPARAQQNCLPFSYGLHLFKGTAAWEELAAREASAPRRREDRGDRLGMSEKRSLLVDDRVYPAFRSLLQGDHLGVEFALSAHQSLLRNAGLLTSEVQILGNHPFPLGDNLQGLVIDDFFALAIHPCNSDPSTSSSQKCFDTAIQAYDAEGVLGSKEKDIQVSRHFKVIGAEINASQKAVSRGVVTVGAPAQKRIAMTLLSLRAAALPIISKGFAAQLAGNWTSIFLYRHCLTCLVSKLYQFSSATGDGEEEVYHLPRSAADELVLASIFSFIACSDLSVGFHNRIYATDASMQKGAVVSREVSEEVAQAVWLSGDKRGAYTVLDPPFKEILKSCGLEEEEDVDLAEKAEQPKKSLEFSFDFVEVCGGAASVSAVMADWGFTVLPPIDISYSPHYDLRDLKVVEWLAYMFSCGRIRSGMLEPVCTSFSPAAHPAVRTYKDPKGHNRTEAKTFLGNLIAFRCLYLAWIMSIYDCPSMLEQPRLSKMAWLSIWQFLLRCKQFEEAVCASCQFGSVHRKEFRLLCYGIDTGQLDVRCPGGHQHVRIEGAYTKPSAQYVPELAKHFARAFATALRRKAHQEANQPDVRGVESVAANDLLVSGQWQVDFQWRWQHAAHINLLESHSYLSLLRSLAVGGGGHRFSALLDSRVAKCAHAKGRSSAGALAPSLRKAAAIQLGYGLYPSLGFAPTRLNNADDPTRDQALRPTDSHSLAQLLPAERFKQLHSVGLSKKAANWVRLTLLLAVLYPAEASSCSLGSPGLGIPFCTLIDGFLDFLSLILFWILPSVTVLSCLGLSVVGFWTFIVLAFGGLALLWGWPVEAAIILMTWCGVLRIGEVFQALRADLVLPCDAAPGLGGAILQIRQPKTRGSAARHQAARIDPQDVVALLSAVFRRKPRQERLWVLSPATLRKRFATLQNALGLPMRTLGKQVPYDLASLRAGGATFLLPRFEDSELVRRRGRWISTRVCEIYIQETCVATYAEAMPALAYQRVQRLVQAFPTILDKALFLLDAQIPACQRPNKLWSEKDVEFLEKAVLSLDKAMDKVYTTASSWKFAMQDLAEKLQQMNESLSGYTPEEHVEGPGARRHERQAARQASRADSNLTNSTEPTVPPALVQFMDSMDPMEELSKTLKAPMKELKSAASKLNDMAQEVTGAMGTFVDGALEAAESKLPKSDPPAILE
eukprot:s726_g6.t1